MDSESLKEFGNGVLLDIFTDQKYQIFILKMSANDNRFNPNFCSSLNSALDFISSESFNKTKKSALIVTGEGKFFSNGLDLKYLMSLSDPNRFLIEHYEPLINKFLTFPLPTIALINGHAFAGGLCLALALDYRLAVGGVERRVLMSMNELLIKASIPAGMLAVLRAKLPSSQVLRDCIYARRWTVPEAFKDGIIDNILQSMSDVIEFVKLKAIEPEFGHVLQSIKCETYREASNLLLDPKSDKLDPFRFALKKSKL